MVDDDSNLDKFFGRSVGLFRNRVGNQVALVVDLFQRFVYGCRLVELELENIDRIIGLDYGVGAACRASCLGRCHERGCDPHQEIEDSLVVVLVLPFRVIRDGTEERPEHRHRFVELSVVKGVGKADDEGVAPVLVDASIAGQQALEQALTDFLVWYGEHVEAAAGAEPLDSQVAALVKDGHGVCRTFRRNIEHVSGGLDALGNFFGVDVEILYLLYQVQRGAGFEPVVREFPVLQCLHHAERVVDVGGIFREMVAIVFFLESLAHLLESHALRLCHRLDFGLHLRVQFFLGDAAQGGVLVEHRDDFQVVEFAEYGELAELGDAGDEDETQVRVKRFQRTVEVAQGLAHVLKRVLVHKGVEERGVVFVNKEDYLFAEFLLGCKNYVF